MSEFTDTDHRLAAMHGYEPATSSLPMLERCARHQQAGGVAHWDLTDVMSRESAPAQSVESLPVAESGARPDAHPLTDDPVMSGG